MAQIRAAAFKSFLIGSEMTEILYCPKNNELLLFTGCYELDVQTKTMILYLQTRRKRMVTVAASELVHIGWL